MKKELDGLAAVYGWDKMTKADLLKLAAALFHYYRLRS